MAGTLNANQIIPDQGQTLYLNGIDYNANVVIGNSATSIATFSPNGNLTVQGSITANTITSASGNVSVTGAVSATGNVSGSNIVSSGTVSGSSVSSTGNISANNITSSYDITASSFNGGPLGGMRNRIINGAMMIDQRNAGASVSNEAYGVDRFLTFRDGTTVACTSQQSTTVPTGFTNSLLFTTTTSGTQTSGNGIGIRHIIEGLNTADLNWGSASAATVTLSFWVRSSLTGSFSGSVSNSAFNRSYPFSYTISSTNTWEYKTISIPGDTSGTWVTNNGIGVRVYWDMGSGSALRGTASSWASSGLVGVTGAVSVVGTNGATFYITGVQLEKGATATPFENRLYGTELALCQRYFESSWDIGSAVGTYGNTSIVACGGGGGTNTTGFIGQASVVYKTTKRSTPTLTIYDTANPPNSGKCTRYTLGTTTSTNETVSIQDNRLTGFNVYSGSGTSTMGIVVAWKSEAEL